MVYNRTEIAIFAGTFSALIQRYGIRNINELNKMANQNLDSSNGCSVSVSMRLYGYDGKMCHRLEYKVKGTHLQASPLFIEVNERIRFTVECNESINGYDEWVKTREGGIVQRKEIKSADIVSILSELDSLSHIPVKL